MTLPFGLMGLLVETAYVPTVASAVIVSGVMRVVLFTWRLTTAAVDKKINPKDIGTKLDFGRESSMLNRSFLYAITDPY